MPEAQTVTACGVIALVAIAAYRLGRERAEKHDHLLRPLPSPLLTAADSTAGDSRWRRLLAGVRMGLESESVPPPGFFLRDTEGERQTDAK